MRRVLVAALVVGIAGVASADTETKGEARGETKGEAKTGKDESSRLFEEGRALAKDGKYEKACRAFARSLELDRAPGTLLNYADCHEHLGHLAQAWRLFDEAAQASDEEGNAERAKFARDRAQALVPKTATVILRLATPDTPGLTVTIGGRTAQPAAEVREVVDPGDVTIEVGAPNMQPYEKREHAEPGLKLVVDVPALTPARPEPTTVIRRRHTRVVAAYTLGGIGAASLVTGVVLGVVARSDYNEQFDNGRCINNSPPLCDSEGYKAQRDAITRANIGTAFGVGGLALLGAGAVVFVTAPKDVVVIPTASAEAGGLAVVGRF